MAKKLPSLNELGLEVFHPGDGFIGYELWPPVQYKDSKKKTILSFIESPRNLRRNLTLLAQIIGLETEAQCLEAHQKRFIRHRNLQVLVAVTIYLVVVSAIVIGFLFLLSRFDTSSSGVAFFIAFILAYLLILIIAINLGLVIAKRLTSILLDRRYADTLAFVACLNLCIHLSQEDALLLPEERKRLIKRSQGLRASLALLPYRYISSTSRSLERARKRFMKMEQYALDVEEQLLLPNSRTQEKLRKELTTFTRILLTSRYGQFRYGKKIPASEQDTQNIWARVLKGILRAIGTLIPLAVFLGLLLYPNQFKFLGTYGDVVAVISLAWLLLAIDTTLNLGFVDRLSTLATAVKGWK